MPKTVPVVIAVALAASAAFSQDGYRGIRRYPPRFPSADSFDGSFNFCRLMYESDRHEDGGMGWWTDYPGADVNLSIRLSELTKMSISRQKTGEPNYLVVRTSDDAMFKCPFLMIEDSGTVRFTSEDVTRLREYFEKGGFMWADDFWGTEAWDQWVSEIGRILPAKQYPIVDLPADHPIFRTLFTINQVPQVPSIQFWRRNGGTTSERGPDSPHPDVRGISDGNGRLMVLMTHNTDIADTWEREGEEEDYFYRFSPDGYAVAMNVLIYAMSH
jgi:hypothetical protein